MAKRVHLPEELINEILLRLPVKTVLHCKCVCKSWFSLISNPNFASSHFQLAASPTNKLVSLGTETLSIDFNASLNNDSSCSSLSHYFLRPGFFYEIGGSCRGFIILHTYTLWRPFSGHLSGASFIYLWNPSTGVQKKIPVSNNAYRISLYGFAYDHSTDDYLIVLGFCHPIIHFEIFSLRANEWKHIEVDSHMVMGAGCDSKVGLLLNDSIHWIFYDYYTLRYVIVAFDLKERRMLPIALPDGFEGASFRDYHGMVPDKLISIWMKDQRTVKIWVMKKYAVRSSWTKIVEFSIDPALHGSLSIVCFTNCGDIIGRDDKGRLIKFNDKGQLLEHYSSPEGIGSRLAVYTESMLSLPFGIEQV